MTDKKKITYIIWSESTGGIEKTLMYYPTNIKGYDYRIFILRPLSSRIEMFNSSFFSEKKYGNQSNLKLYPELFKYARKNRDSVFHVLNAGPVILFILKMAGCTRILYHIHGTVYWKKNYKKVPTRLLWKVALSNNVKIIANSKHSKAVFQENINNNYPIEVVYNPFETPNDEGLNNAHKDLSVYYVGRLVNGKNLYLWLDIALKLIRKFSNISFHLYGIGNLEETLKGYAIKLGIEDKVIFHGFVKEIETIYKKHDLLMFLSEYESFGNVVVESILYETPVIAKPIPSIKEIFTDFPEFLLTENKDYTEQVADRLENLTELKTKAKIAKESFTNQFSLGNHLDRFTELYEQY